MCLHWLFIVILDYMQQNLTVYLRENVKFIGKIWTTQSLRERNTLADIKLTDFLTMPVTLSSIEKSNLPISVIYLPFLTALWQWEGWGEYTFPLPSLLSGQMPLSREIKDSHRSKRRTLEAGSKKTYNVHYPPVQ